MVDAEQRLWAPWRMRYIGGGATEDGCVFCNRLRAGNDVESLILLRGPNAFVIMNLFPYNTGHVMIVPNQHVADLADLPFEAAIDMTLLAPQVTGALRRVLSCAGFNLGLNIGDVAGAGVAAHLHQHVVPRWVGDANFMPILASTMVIPELIPTTYAKIRAELQREMTANATCRAIVLTDDDRSVVLQDGALPTATASEKQPVWKAALGAVQSVAGDLEIAGWAGSERADASAGPLALTLRAVKVTDAPGREVVGLTEALDRLDEREAVILHRARANLAPSIAAPDDRIGQVSSS